MPEERRLVSVLFADLVGSTAIGAQNDPEIVRGVLARYFEEMRRVAEAHGGTVEKFIGDAVMAVFGVPSAHDDDAERAVRAGLLMRDAAAGLNLDPEVQLVIRVGVNTGEAVAGTGPGLNQTLVTGDVVNVAARIQQAADPGEVLVGPLTERLTRPAIEYEAHPAIEAKGKPEPVPVSRAVRPRSVMPDQARGLPRMQARLVGRERELRLLVDTFGRAAGDERAQLFTVVGNAGVGKSRLVAEFLARVGSTGDVVVRRGRCLPYGTGITWWPFVEIVQADTGITYDEARNVATEQLDRRLGELFRDQRERAAVHARLAVMLGLAEMASLPDVPAERLAGEVGWGLRRYAEAVAASAPTVFVIDDLQWAEPPFVEALRSIVDRVLAAPILIVCIARPDLLERHPTWGGGQANSALIVLEPLSDEETRTLVARLLDIDDLPEAVRAEIVRRSEGNPLFCEEILRMLIDDGQLTRDGDRWRAVNVEAIRVPESIQALLSGRLDGLAAEEKRAVQAASIVGERLELDELAGLLPDLDARSALESLERRGIIVEDRAGGPSSYRFRHILIRDVAYGMIPKLERAAIHLAFERVLAAELGQRRDELTEILAHHAERSLRLSLDVRLTGPELAERAREALDLALAAAERAVRRRDLPGIRAFLATSRLALDTLGGEAESSEDEATFAIVDAERRVLEADYVKARTLVAQAIELAQAAHRTDLEARGQLALARILAFAAASSEEEFATADASSARAAELFGQLGDTAGRIAAQTISLENDFGEGRLSRMIEKGLPLVEEALASGARAEAAPLLSRLGSAASWLGQPALADELLAKALTICEEASLVATARFSRFFIARLAWMRGDVEEAVAQVQPLVGESDDAGDGQVRMATRRLLVDTRIVAGRLPEAAAVIDEALELSVKLGERWHRTELLAYRARLETEVGNLSAAEADIEASRATLRDRDRAGRATFQESLALLRAAQGRDAEADAAFEAAVEAYETTDYWSWTMPALSWAATLVARGRTEEARSLYTRIAARHATDGFVLRWPIADSLRKRLAPSPRTASPEQSTA
jgi:class 3 adenylate cyclase/tetratricopeptide (TPR) repeat protein